MIASNVLARAELGDQMRESSRFGQLGHCAMLFLALYG
jgi:hypothetical protein